MIKDYNILRLLNDVKVNIFILINSFCSSCDTSSPTVPVEEITVSENVVLGMDIDSMYQFLKESGVKSQTFINNNELY